MLYRADVVAPRTDPVRAPATSVATTFEVQRLAGAQGGAAPFAWIHRYDAIGGIEHLSRVTPGGTPMDLLSFQDAGTEHITEIAISPEGFACVGTSDLSGDAALYYLPATGMIGSYVVWTRCPQRRQRISPASSPRPPRPAFLLQRIM